MKFFYTCPGKMGPSDSRHTAASSGRGKEECQLGAHFRLAVLQGLVQKNHLERLKARINEG